MNSFLLAKNHRSCLGRSWCCSRLIVEFFRNDEFFQKLLNRSCQLWLVGMLVVRKIEAIEERFHHAGRNHAWILTLDDDYKHGCHVLLILFLWTVAHFVQGSFTSKRHRELANRVIHPIVQLGMKRCSTVMIDRERRRRRRRHRDDGRFIHDLLLLACSSVCLFCAVQCDDVMFWTGR